jgi:hypothetical protein
MTTAELHTFFRERADEVFAFLRLLEDVETAARSGPPRLANTLTPITTSQQKILYSSLYLQLYNLVEATVARCIDAVVTSAADGSSRPSDLNKALRAEWVRSFARTHVDLNASNRLKHAVEMCEQILGQLPLEVFKVESGGGGNWDDTEIEVISRRMGCGLQITPTTLAAVKRVLRDDLGALKLVKSRRNDLAHGSLSFVDCGEGLDVAELKNLTDAVVNYLAEAITCFGDYIDMRGFLATTGQAAGT